MQFRVLKSFRHLEEFLQEGVIAEIREDLVEGLIAEGWIENPNSKQNKK